jgi:recombination protein RecR
MAKIPHSIQALIDALSDLPSLGPRQASRLAFYLAENGYQKAENLLMALQSLQGNIRSCSNCYFIHENPDGLCDICRDKTRKQNIIMLVEKETDLISLEQARNFNGIYLVLGQIPKTGTLKDWQKNRLEGLKRKIENEFNGQAEEIILGISPSNIGDWNASILKRELENYAKKITRLGRGLPTGGEIEFADDQTLAGALETRN